MNGLKQDAKHRRSATRENTREQALSHGQDNVVSFKQHTEAVSGMPPMDDSGPAISRHEFWPAWFFYTPVVMQSLWHSIKYRSIGLPLIANPSVWLSGMVGESKKDILNLAGDYAKQWILPFTCLRKNTESIAQQYADAQQAIEDANLSFPLVAKPDKGCRGVGVKLLKDKHQLKQYIEDFPVGADYMLQQKSSFDAEVGVFYVRYPGNPKGEIISLGLKYAPHVKGDGVHTLEQLIDNDPRAGQLAHLYKHRHQEKLNWVVPQDMSYRLAFAGSHSRGCIFKDGNRYISQALTEQFDAIFHDVDGFYFGRMDVKFKDIDSLMQGKAFQIIEMNGASSESAHMWDSKTPMRHIFATLLKQYRMLYEIGYLQKQRGHTPPSLLTLYRAWREEKSLEQHYPSTD